MKRSIVIAIACALVLNSTQSVYALGIPMRAKIQDIIRDINKGTLSGSAIVDEIKKLKYAESDLNDPLFRDLNETVYNELKNQGWKLNSMKVVQDIRKGMEPTVESRSTFVQGAPQGTLTGWVPFYESKSTLIQTVPIIDVLLDLSEPKPTKLTASAVLSNPKPTKLMASKDNQIIIAPEGAIVIKTPEEKKVVLAEMVNKVNELAKPSVPLSGDATPFQVNTVVKDWIKDNRADIKKIVEQKPDVNPEKASSFKLLFALKDGFTSMFGLNPPVKVEPKVLSTGEPSFARRVLQTFGLSPQTITEAPKATEPQQRVILPPLDLSARIEEVTNMAVSTAELNKMMTQEAGITLGNRWDAEDKAAAEAEKARLATLSPAEQKEEVKKIEEKINKADAEITEAIKKAEVNNDTERVGILQQAKNWLGGLPKIFGLTRKEAPAKPTAPQPKPNTITYDDLKAFNDLLDTVIEREYFKKSTNLSYKGSQIPYKELHKEFKNLIDHKNDIIDKSKDPEEITRDKNFYETILEKYLLLQYLSVEHVLKTLGIDDNIIKITDVNATPQTIASFQGAIVQDTLKEAAETRKLIIGVGIKDPEKLLSKEPNKPLKASLELYVQLRLNNLFNVSNGSSDNLQTYATAGNIIKIQESLSEMLSGNGTQYMTWRSLKSIFGTEISAIDSVTGIAVAYSMHGANVYCVNILDTIAQIYKEKAESTWKNYFKGKFGFSTQLTTPVMEAKNNYTAFEKAITAFANRYLSEADKKAWQNETFDLTKFMNPMAHANIIKKYTDPTVSSNYFGYQTNSNITNKRLFDKVTTEMGKFQ